MAKDVARYRSLTIGGPSPPTVGDDDDDNGTTVTVPTQSTRLTRPPGTSSESTPATAPSTPRTVLTKALRCVRVLVIGAVLWSGYGGTNQTPISRRDVKQRLYECNITRGGAYDMFDRLTMEPDHGHALLQIQLVKLRYATVLAWMR